MGEDVKIIFAGDTFPVPKNFELFRSGDTEALFGSRVCELFQTADYRVCNLEGCLTDSGEPIAKMGPSVKAPTDTLYALKKLGINAATLANTHALDYGKTGHDEMCAALEKNGIRHFETGDDTSSVNSYIKLTIKSKTIILYTVTEPFRFNTPTGHSGGANGYDEYAVCKELYALKKQCDYLAVLYHGGVEMTHCNTPTVRRRFHRMADNGADIIISQHTHAVGFEESYNGAYLLYGQGNFCFNLSPGVSEFTRDGILLEADFGDEGFSVNKHLLRRTELGCTYDENQDFTAFDERSRLHELMLKGDSDAQRFFDRELDRVSKFWMNNLMRRIFEVDLPDDGCVKYLTERFSKQQLLALNMLLINDEFNEIAVRCLRMAIDSEE